MTQTRALSVVFSRGAARVASLTLIASLLAPAIVAAQPAAPTQQPAPQQPAPQQPAPQQPAPQQAPSETAVPPDAPPAPPSQEQVQAAQTELQAGQQAYQAGDYAGAIIHFQQSNQIVPSPEAQFWLAMSLDLRGDAAQAIAHFETLLQNPRHTELTESQIAAAQNRLSVLKQIPATFALTVNPADAELLIDGVPQPGMSPFSLKLKEGSHSMTIQREGYEAFETQVLVKAAEDLADTIELKPLPEAAPPPPPPTTLAPAAPPPEPPSKVPAYVTLGVAGASAIVGTIFGIQALSAESEFEDNPTASNADDVERNALIADMAFGVALTLGITGVVLLTSEEPTPEAPSARVERKPSLAIAPYASPDGAGAAARLKF